jgi:hypothetical protein
VAVAFGTIQTYNMFYKDGETSLFTKYITIIITNGMTNNILIARSRAPTNINQW